MVKATVVREIEDFENNRKEGENEPVDVFNKKDGSAGRMINNAKELLSSQITCLFYVDFKQKSTGKSIRSDGSVLNGRASLLGTSILE